MTDRNRSATTMQSERFATGGTLALSAGLILILARALETSFGIPGLPRSWYQNDWLWWLVGLLSTGAGIRLLIRSESDALERTGWKPTIPGRRFKELQLYTRQGCHLCDEALDLIRHYRPWLPPVSSIDIENDPKLVDQFGTCVPVIAFDGKVRFRGKVNEILLRRLIEGTPPG